MNFGGFAIREAIYTAMREGRNATPHQRKPKERKIKVHRQQRQAPSVEFKSTAEAERWLAEHPERHVSRIEFFKQ